MRMLISLMLFATIFHLPSLHATARSADESEMQYADKQLEDPAQEAAATKLMFDLRCVQCQGQSIADSDAPIALAMRHEVRSRIKKGETPGDIRAFFVSRYGDYITFEPKASGGGLLLWIAPILLLGIAVLLSLRLFRKPTA